MSLSTQSTDSSAADRSPRIAPPAAHFSADAYDRYAAPQRFAASALLDAITDLSPATILEPGCGTGLFTRMLLDRFAGASVLAFDISPAAITAARERIPDPRATFDVADAATFSGGHHDLVTANALFQWLPDPTSTVAQYARMVRPGGALAFSAFGPRTYTELADAMAHVFGASVSVASASFADEARWETAMHAAFEGGNVQEHSYSVEFPSLKELLLSIRHTGNYRRAVSPSVWTPSRFTQVERFYQASCGSITATYQVFVCVGYVR
ncbi:MAG TPA: methyltransferase domain-containing protein [Capsulimonadaceae bacterium]|jgi:malonyl-CoA O-methyltransferase